MAIYTDKNGRRTYTGPDSPREAVRGGIKKMEDSVRAVNRSKHLVPLSKEDGIYATPMKPKRPKGTKGPGGRQ